jgi:hypothetical protein
MHQTSLLLFYRPFNHGRASSGVDGVIQAWDVDANEPWPNGQNREEDKCASIFRLVLFVIFRSFYCDGTDPNPISHRSQIRGPFQQSRRAPIT